MFLSSSYSFFPLKYPRKFPLTLKEERLEHELMMPMEQVRSSEGGLKAGDGLMEIPAVQVPKALNQLDQAQRHREDERKLTQMIRGKQG